MAGSEHNLRELMKMKKYQLINYHWKSYKESLLERTHTKFILITIFAIIGISLGVALWGSMVENLTWWLTLLMPFIGFLIGGSGLIIVNTKENSRLNEFNFKKIAYAGLFIISLLLLFWWAFAIAIWGQTYFSDYKLRVVVDMLNMFNLGLASILTLYIGHHRIKGPGEFQCYLIKLYADILYQKSENKPKVSPVRDIMKDLERMVKGLDDWCAEILGIRIENIENFKKDWITDITLNMAEFIGKLTKFCNQSLIDKISKNEGWNDSSVLSSILHEIQPSFQTVQDVGHEKDKFHEKEFQLRFYRETLRTSISRNVGKSGALSTLFGTLSGIAGFVIIFL